MILLMLPGAVYRVGFACCGSYTSYPYDVHQVCVIEGVLGACVARMVTTYLLSLSVRFVC